MTRSFGPAVIIDPATNLVDRVTCNYCIFRNWRDVHHVCTYGDSKIGRPLPDPSNTPDWCEMKAGAIRDSLDTANGVTHRVWRHSGRRTDHPRVIYEGIPSEAERQFRLASRDAKRGSVRLMDGDNKQIAVWSAQ